MLWGGLVALKGLWDCFWGQPEANFFSPHPWEFVTREQWSRYAGFELTYGVACAALGWGLMKWAQAQRLPTHITHSQG
jgi:hypothetical protein